MAGHKIMRIITSENQATMQKGVAEKDVKLGVVHARIAQQTAAYSKAGQATKMESYNRGWMDYIKKDVAVGEELAAKNVKFETKNKKANIAFQMKSKPAVSSTVKKNYEQEADAYDEAMINFEMGKNLEEEEE